MPHISSSSLDQVRRDIEYVRTLNRILDEARQKPVRYTAETVRDLLNALKIEDWDNTDGTSNQRGAAANALEQSGRQAEADLLRSRHPVVVTANGRVKKRAGNSDYHTAFRVAYRKALLDHSTDERGNRLSNRYEPHHLDAETGDEADKRAALFVSEALKLIGKLSPDQLAAALVRSHNRSGSDFTDQPFTADFDSDRTERLNDKSLAMGGFFLTPKGRKATKGQRPPGLV
jgi:hypothetical protein